MTLKKQQKQRKPRVWKEWAVIRDGRIETIWDERKHAQIAKVQVFPGQTKGRVIRVEVREVRR